MQWRNPLIKIVILVVMISCTSANQKQHQTNITDEISPIESSLSYYKGELCTVQIENILYEGPNPDYFYIKVQIKNTSDNIIGIDLSDKWKIIYPNQWGDLHTPQRQVINERRVVPDKLDSLKKLNLITHFNNKELEFIGPNETFTYYTEFNANGKAAIDETAEIGNYFFLSLDGQLFLTDGNKCERISFEEDAQ